MKYTALVASFVLPFSCSKIEHEDAATVEKQFIEISRDELSNIAVNHAQGSIGFTVEEEYYFYYLDAPTASEKVVATAALFNDLQKASTLQIASVEHGLHRKIINLLLFYGDRQIPENLKRKRDSEESTSNP